MMDRRGVASVDLLLGAAILAALASGVWFILASAEHWKRANASAFVHQIALANKGRRSGGQAAFTGRIGAASPVVSASEDLKRLDFANDPYAYFGAEGADSPCILASATRRAEGPNGTSRSPYAKWGVCESSLGEVQAYQGACTLSCVKPVAAPAPVEALLPQPARKPTKRHEAGDLVPTMHHVETPAQGPKTSGCAMHGCAGNQCCDMETDRCVACPGGSCCEQGLGCKGSCSEDDDCLQGCRCVKFPGSPWGTCKGG